LEETIAQLDAFDNLSLLKLNIAEFAIARVAELAPKPRSVDHLRAAAIPLSALTRGRHFVPRRFSARASVS
jgi:hypothetical protein